MSYYPYFDQEEPQIPVKGLIVDQDNSPSYELEALGVYKAEGRGYLVVHVSGCSCWPDRGGTDQRVCHTKVDVQKALREFGYIGLMDRLQAANWKAQKE